MPFEKRSKSFIKATHDMLTKLKELRRETSSKHNNNNTDFTKLEENCESKNITNQEQNNKTALKRQQSSSLEDISSMSSSVRESDTQSLKLDTKIQSFQNDVIAAHVQCQKPVNFAAQLNESLKHSNLFNRQATLHNRRSLSVDHLSVSNEFINSIKIDDETNSTTGGHTFQKPQKFPIVVSNDDNDDVGGAAVVVRKKTQPNAVRAKTLNYDLQGGFQGKPNEIKGVTKIVIGDELCAKINRQEKLVLDHGIHIIDNKSGMNKMLKEQIELRPGYQQLDKKNVVLHDINNVPIQLFFDTSKDAKYFVESERLNVPLPNEKLSIKTKLLRLLGKRSSREFLVEKGIYMNETIFGNTIHNIYQMHECVPEFLTKSIQLIEMPNNINQVGIYRTSGNLATIQKIRFEVDKGNLNILEQYYEDVDVLTGALKLFFRELKEPLIPISTCDELHAVSEKNRDDIGIILRKLPRANYETLMCLLKHLLNIVEYKETNKMDVYNLTICWAPSLMFVPDNCLDVMAQSSNNSKILDLLLNYFKEHPKELTNHLERIDRVRNETKLNSGVGVGSSHHVQQNKKSSSCTNLNDSTYETVTKLIELIESNSKIDGLYKKQGSQVKIDKITKKLTKGKMNEIEKFKCPDTIHDVVGILRKYLNDLNEPLIPKEVFFDEYFNNGHCDNLNLNIVKIKLKNNIEKLVKRRDLLILLLKHLVRILNDGKFNKATLNDLFVYWKNVLIRTNHDDKFKMKLMENLLEIYGDYRVNDTTMVALPNPMPDVIKDIEAMGVGRFSKYENVSSMIPSQKMIDSTKGEAKFLDDKTDE